MAELFDEGFTFKSRCVIDEDNAANKKEFAAAKASEFDKTAAEEDFQSLEYEEDCFYIVDGSNTTPSFDEDVTEEDVDNSYWILDPDLYEDLQVSDGSDGEGSPNCKSSFGHPGLSPRVLVFRSGHLVRRVRLGILDWAQRKRNYRRILAAIKQKVSKMKGEEPGLIITPDGEGELDGLTEEEKIKQREIWQTELAKVEEEIETLKNVLKSKIRLSQQLKKKLGFTVWREISDDLSQGVKTVKETAVYQSVGEGLSNLGKAVVESPAYHTVEDKISSVGKVVSENPVYQRTESVVKMTAESTRSIIGGLTGGFTQKMGQIKNSESFRSLEDKVGSAYENVKTKVASRSSSLQSFDDALREDSDRRSSAAMATSPTIPEDKPIS